MKWFVLALFVVLTTTAEAAMRQQPESVPAHAGGGEASLVLPDLGQVSFLGYNSRTLLVGGLGICVLGLLFGLVTYSRLQKLPVHRSMLEVSELIYETCKTYLVTQGKFILILEVFVGLIIALYFGLILHFPLFRVGIILLFSLVGIAGELRRRVVRHPGQHVRELADGVREPARASRIRCTRFRSKRG